MKNNRYTNWFFAAAVVVAGFSMAACEDEPDKYEVAGGKPTLKYVRVPDPAAAIIVQKIFEMAVSGTGATAIVRYLNEQSLPTPIQYARSNGLSGNFDDGSGNWNSRSVKYILTNRTYTGMLVQGKEKRAVMAAHEPLVDSATFDAIQKAFQARAYNMEHYEQYVRGEINKEALRTALDVAHESKVVLAEVMEQKAV